MFGRRHITDEAAEARLSALAGTWKGIVPKASFEAAVWRNIRTETAAQHVSVSGWRNLTEWLLLSPPVCLPSLAVAVLFLMAGTWLGVATGYDGMARRAAAVQPLIAAHTLVGAYASLSTGGYP